jgi:hypothetical protein
MNGAKVQQKIYAGYTKAATRIGKQYNLYRPSAIDKVIHIDNLIIADLDVALSQDIKFIKPNKYGNAVWWALLDGSLTQVGDYLTNGTETYFVQAMPQILPITLVECNALIKVVRPHQANNIGRQGYGGDRQATEGILMEGWPCSQLQGSKWERNQVALPGDERLPWWVFLFPYWPGVDLRTSDIIIDQFNRRIVISSTEHTSYGWRITAGLSGA